MASYEAVGSVKGCKVFWKRETGEIFIRKPAFFGSTDIKMKPRAYSIAAAFAIAEEYVKR